MGIVSKFCIDNQTKIVWCRYKSWYP